MSTPTPLLPPGALEGPTAPKSRVRITVLTILALHVVFIGGLLLQGCDKNNRSSGTLGAASNTLTTLPPLTDSNYFSSFPGDAPSGTGARPAPVDSPSYTTPAATNLRQEPAVADVVAPSSQSTYPANALTTPAPTAALTGTGTEHVIKKNDTIGSLAKKYGVSERAIFDANPGVKPRSLKINDRLIIPAAPPNASAGETPGPGGGEVYVVKAGDNLTKIAGKFGVTVKQLRAANNLRSDRLVAKQRLVIPPKSGARNGATNPPAPAPTF